MDCPTNASLVLTNESLFVNKARMMTSCHFVIGYDTYIRILNPKYYNNSVENLCKALDEFKKCKTTFVVAGRLVGDKWQIVDERLELVPEGYKDLFTTLNETEFRMDISSTELREQGKGVNLKNSKALGKELPDWKPRL